MMLNPRTIRPPWASILGVLVALGLTACSDSSGPETDPTAPSYPGIDELGRPLKQLASAGCTIASKVLTINVAANETAIIGKASGTGTGILVNGVACGTATTATVSKISVAAAAPATVIVDFANNVFMPGSAAAVGWDIVFTGASNSSVKVRGSSAADTYYVGGTNTAVKLGVNGDTNADVSATASGGGAISVVLSGGPGNDTLSGAGGFGTGSAYSGDLWLWGGAGNDTLTGGAGADKVVGGDGADTLTGGAGNDTLWGEADADTFRGESGTSTGSDYYFGGSGTSTDVMDYTLRTVALTIVMDATWTGDYTTGSATGTLSGDDSGAEGDLVGADIENLLGGSGDDAITGNALNNRLEGRAGSDSFVESADTSTDVFVGAGGTAADAATGDTVDYRVRTEALVLRITGTAVSGESGENDTISTDIEKLIGGSGNDALWGSSANNTLDGGGGDDILHGQAGDDALIGGDGNDTMYGEDGDDAFLATNATSTDGDDVVLCGAGSSDALDYSVRTAAMTVDLTQGGSSTGLTAGGENDTISNASSTTDDCEVAVGGTGGDNILVGNTLDNTLDGYTSTGTTIDGAGGVDMCVNVQTGTNCEL